MKTLVWLWLALSLTCGTSLAQTAAPAETAAIALTRPGNGETIHNNLGEVPVAVTLPSTALDAGNRLRVLLDGKPYGADQKTREFTLTNVDRGEHTLQVQIIDARNTVLAGSNSVTFYMWRASKLFPKK